MESLSKVFAALEFAAKRHIGQTRKGTMRSPYINHPISVMATLSQHGENNEDLLAAAALHDVIEDTAKDKEEIEKLSATIIEIFGENVLNIVLEVSDDKTLSYQKRKHLQIINTPFLSNEAKKLKIADKSCNIKDLISDPPSDWSIERKLSYLEWAMKVIDGARGISSALEQHFESVVQEAYNKLTNQSNESK